MNSLLLQAGFADVGTVMAVSGAVQLAVHSPPRAAALKRHPLLTQLAASWPVCSSSQQVVLQQLKEWSFNEQL